MFNYNEDQVWDGCIDQWEKMVADLPEDFDSMDERSKTRVIQDLKVKHSNIYLCLFCAAASITDVNPCKRCPGVLVDPSFNCFNNDYYFSHKPRKFLAELKRLNKIRCEKKR